MRPVCARSSYAIILIVGWPFRPYMNFDDTDSAFPLISLWVSIKEYIVGSPTILVSIGAGNSTRTLYTMFAVPTVLSCSIDGINGRFFLWDDKSNLLKI